MELRELIKIAICDDDPKDIHVIKTVVKNYMEDREISYQIDTFSCGEELLDSHQEYHFVFLDIAMGEGMNGIMTGKQFQRFHRNTKIIYITSFHQYCEVAVNDVHAFAYLQKPIKREKLQMQLRDLLEIVEEEREESQSISFEIFKITKDYRMETKIEEFTLDEIFYFEYMNRKIKVITSKGDFYFSGQMKKLIGKMSEFSFESCHRNYLVNLKYVMRIKGYEVYLKNGAVIPVSQKKSFEFREKLNSYIQKMI